MDVQENHSADPLESESPAKGVVFEQTSVIEAAAEQGAASFESEKKADPAEPVNVVDASTTTPAAADADATLGKRKADDSSVLEAASPTSERRPRLNVNKVAKAEGSHTARSSGKERWRPHKMVEDYTNFVGDLMYPKNVFGPYGSAPEQGRFPISRVNTLGYLTSALRRPTVLEKWSPYEVAVFEGCLTLFGKDFWQAAKVLKTKSTMEVIEFYYSWKKTDHYKQWKRGYVPDVRDFPEGM